MRRLAACARPHKDEFWFGYLMRLADMNGFGSVMEFESRVFYSGHPPERHGGILYPSNAARICAMFSAEPLFPDVRMLVDAMTTYRHDAARLTAPEQARLLEYMMSDTSHAATPGVMTKYDKELRFCPECMKEDREMCGHGYLHTLHQYRDTRTCPMHGHPLRMLKMSRSTRFSQLCLDGEELEAQDDVPAAEDKRPIDIRPVRCSACGTEYMAHGYSERSGMPCPVCASRQDPAKVLQDRLDALYGGGYRISRPGTTTWSMTVEHTACGSQKRNIENLLWKERRYCAACRSLTTEKVQERLDRSAPGFTAVRMVPKRKEKTRMIVRHEDCGREFEIQAADMVRQPRCMACAKEGRWNDIREIDPDYEILEVPENNRRPMLIRHKRCCLKYRMLKQTFAEGGRCPVCTCNYDLQMVRDALKKCAPAYSAEKHHKRGFVILYKDGKLVRGRVSYRQVMQDLAQGEGKIVKEVKSPFVPPVSKRADVYDEVKKMTKQKGKWTHADGIGGKPVTPRQQNILQELANAGYITRIDTGEYAVIEEEG